MLAVIVDVISGKILLNMMSNAKPSTMKDMFDVTRSCKEDIVVLGSSRAAHHYDSRIIEDSLEMSCVNYGSQDNGIVLMYGRYKMLTRYHIPKMIIYDIHSPFDLWQGDNSKYLPRLRPFASDSTIRNYIYRIDESENLKLNSNLYRFNGMFQELLAVQFRADNNLYHGYAPLYGQMKSIPVVGNTKEQPAVTDTLKLNLFREMIKDCNKKGVKLCFLVSPSFKRGYFKTVDPILKMCRDYGVPYELYDKPDAFPLECGYFFDSSHLNDKGAKLYTKKVIPFLRKVLNQ